MPHVLAVPFKRAEIPAFILLLEKEISYQLLILQKYKDPLKDQTRIYESYKQRREKIIKELNQYQNVLDQLKTTKKT